MKKPHLVICSAISALAISSISSAHAQTSRLYLAGYLGLNVFNNQEFTESTTSNAGEFQVDNSLSLAGALGMRLSRHIRLEGELSYRNAEFSAADLTGIGTFSSGGELKSTILFANAFYDFNTSWPIEPYVGAGIGYGWHKGEINDGTGQLVNLSSDDSGFMWNAAAGVKYRPRVDLAFTAGYRYLDSFNLEFGSYEIDYASHEFRLGMEWDLPLR